MTAGPARLTDTPPVLTVPVVAALQLALLDAAVSSGPAVVTSAGLARVVESPVRSTARDTLPGRGVQLATVHPQPAFLTDTGPGNTVTVARAVRVRTVRVPAELSLVTLHADTLPVLTVAVSAAVRDLALLVPDVALLPLPAGLADTLPAAVLPLAAAEERTDGEEAGLPVIAGLTVALARHTVPPPVTILPAPGAQLSPAAGEELHLVRGPVIVIQRHEPVTFLQVQLLHPLH